MLALVAQKERVESVREKETDLCLLSQQAPWQALL